MRQILEAKAERIIREMMEWNPDIDALQLADLLQEMVEMAMEEVEKL